MNRHKQKNEETKKKTKKNKKKKDKSRTAFSFSRVKQRNVPSDSADCGAREKKRKRRVFFFFFAEHEKNCCKQKNIPPQWSVLVFIKVRRQMSLDESTSGRWMFTSRQNVKNQFRNSIFTERNKSSEAGETATEIIQLSVKICPMFWRINSPNRLWPMCGFRAEY